MKKIIIIMLLLAVSVFAQQNMSGNITQPVNGSFALAGSAYCMQLDRQIIFGPTAFDESIGARGCLRSDFFEANGILSCNPEEYSCNLTTTLYDEAINAFVETEKEDDLMEDAFEFLNESTDCLVGVYNGSIVNASEEQDINVGAHLYFNTVKPCFVRTIAALGMLEQIFIDEENASFLVQKFQELEVDYQHYLTREDLIASSSFSVPKATLTGTVTGAAGGAQPDLDSLNIEIQSGGPQAVTYTITVNDATNSLTTAPIVGKATLASDITQTPYGSGTVTIADPDGMLRVLRTNAQTTTEGQMYTIVFSILPTTMPYTFSISTASAMSNELLSVEVYSQRGGEQDDTGLNDNWVIHYNGASNTPVQGGYGIGGPDAASIDASAKMISVDGSAMTFEGTWTTGMTGGQMNILTGSNDGDGFNWYGEKDLQTSMWFSQNLNGFNVEAVIGWNTFRDPDQDSVLASDVDVAVDHIASTMSTPNSDADFALENNYMDLGQASEEGGTNANFGLSPGPSAPTGTFQFTFDETTASGETTRDEYVTLVFAGGAADGCAQGDPLFTNLPPSVQILSYNLISDAPPGLGGFCVVRMYVPKGTSEPFTATANKASGVSNQVGFLGFLSVDTDQSDNAIAGGALVGLAQIPFTEVGLYSEVRDITPTAIGFSPLGPGVVSYSYQTFSGQPYTLGLFGIVHYAGDAPAWLSGGADPALTPFLPATNILIDAATEPFAFSVGYLQGPTTGGGQSATFGVTPSSDVVTIASYEYQGNRVNPNTNNIMVQNSVGTGFGIASLTGAALIDFEGEPSGIYVLGIAAFLVTAIFLFILTRKQQ